MIASSFNTSRAILYLKNKIQLFFFIEMTVLTTWSIWITRNNLIFNQIDPNFAVWRITFLREFALVIHRVKAKFKPDISAWFNSLN